MPRSRQEVNLRQLLNRCEMMANEEQLEGNWRLKKYVETLNEMIINLKSGPQRPSKDVLMDYARRIHFLKGLIQTAAISSPIEKVEAVQLLSHGSSAVNTHSPTVEIHQKTVAKYGNELRSELFGLDSDDTLRQRNIIKSANFTSNGTNSDDMDTLLKYHQGMQEKVAENMVLLTKSLKEQSEIASTIIRRDTEALKQSSELTDKNIDSLRVESERLQEHSRGAWKCWLWILMALVMIIFINMVLFMKVVKKKKL